MADVARGRRRPILTLAAAARCRSTITPPLLAAARSRSTLTPPLAAQRRSILTLAAAAQFEQVIKKSRFCAFAAPVNSAKAASEFVRAVSEPKATHNVHAWRLENGESHSNNDGEPHGTAGPPILSAICQADLYDVAVVVTRYYGGVQLGTGGLVRAYGGTAAACLASATCAQLVGRVRVRVSYSAVDSGPVFAIIGASLSHIESFENGRCEATLEVAEESLERLSASLKNATAGRVEVEMLRDSER